MKFKDTVRDGINSSTIEVTEDKIKISVEQDKYLEWLEERIKASEPSYLDTEKAWAIKASRKQAFKEAKEKYLEGR